MAEHIEVGRPVAAAESVGKPVQPGFASLEHLRFGVALPAGSGPAAREPEHRAGMKRLEQRDADLVAEHATDQFRLGVVAAERVAVTGQHPAAVDLEHAPGLLHDVYAQFLFEIVGHPPVVVAAEEPDIGPLRHLGQRREHAHAAARHHVAVVHPEIEDVAQQVERLQVGRKRLQVLHERPLPDTAGIGVRPQMQVGHEEMASGCGHC